MSVHQFRRFTYFFKSESQNFSEIIVQFKSEEFQNELKQLGILAVEIYNKEQDYFLIIDANPSKNGSDLRAISSNFEIEKSPLERIYELDQKVVYKPCDGQLKNKIGAKKRFVWTLLLQENPELMAEYKKVHSIGKAWPEITANMKSIGVIDMEIYLSGTQAILIMDTIPNFNLEEIGPKWQKLPRENEWQEYVAKFQRTDPESSIQEKWMDMIRI